MNTKKKIAAVVAGVVMATGFAQPAHAARLPGVEIVASNWVSVNYPEVTAYKYWGAQLRIPIRRVTKCTGRYTHCVRIYGGSMSYRYAAYTYNYSDGTSTIIVNSWYVGRSANFKQAILTHELGHVSGLGHRTDCGSVMNYMLPCSGTYSPTWFSSYEKYRLGRWR